MTTTMVDDTVVDEQEHDEESAEADAGAELTEHQRDVRWRALVRKGKALASRETRLVGQRDEVRWQLGDLALEIEPVGSRGTRTGSQHSLHQAAQEIETISFSALFQYRSVANAWPDSTRVTSASWSAHRALIRVDRDEAHRWLDDHPGCTEREAKAWLHEVAPARTDTHPSTPSTSSASSVSSAIAPSATTTVAAPASAPTVDTVEGVLELIRNACKRFEWVVLHARLDAAQRETVLLAVQSRVADLFHVRDELQDQDGTTTTTDEQKSAA